MPIEIVSLVLVARRGVLPTRLSAVEEAGGIDILCSDKTGTLTRNELAVMVVQPLSASDEAHVLALPARESSDAGQDPVDIAIRTSAAEAPITGAPRLLAFVPFDPTLKRASATVCDKDGSEAQVIKGAHAVIAGLCRASPQSSTMVDALRAKGFRVLTVVSESPGADGDRGLDGDRHRQVRCRGRIDRAWPGWDRRYGQGRSHDVPARADVCAAADCPQDCAGSVPGSRLVHHGACDPYPRR